MPGPFTIAEQVVLYTVAFTISFVIAFEWITTVVS